MSILRKVGQVLGFLLIFSGCFWALQGMGIIMWPKSSFMLADRQWVTNGAVTAVVGLILVWLARRRG